MTKQDLLGLLDYHYWACDRLFKAVEPLTAEQFTRDLGSSFKSIRDTLVHIYSAEWTWFSRWQGQGPTAHVPAGQFADVTAIRNAWTDLETKLRGFVNELSEDGVTRVFEYRLFNGQPGATPLWQMLHHLVNHASYHRGQVTTMLRQLGAEPPQSLDAMAFYREQQSQL
jgi:uncharacterized damage-inducible protein DinB